MRTDFERHLLLLLTQRPQIHLPSVHQLLGLCRQQAHQETNAAWITFWNLAARYFNALRRDEPAQWSDAEAATAAQVLNGVLLHQSFANLGPEAVNDLDTINQMLFLDQADALTRGLAQSVGEHLSEGAAWPEGAADSARLLAQLAQDVSLAAVQQLADALATQLERVGANPATSEAQASLQGVEELSRLLHQFAGGTIGTPEPAVLSALRGAA